MLPERCANGQAKVLFPESYGKSRVDDRRVMSGIIFSNRNGLCWLGARAEFGHHKTLYSRWKCWSEKRLFVQVLLELADHGGRIVTLMIDVKHLKMYGLVSSL